MEEPIYENYVRSIEKGILEQYSTKKRRLNYFVNILLLVVLGFSAFQGFRLLSSFEPDPAFYFLYILFFFIILFNSFWDLAEWLELKIANKLWPRLLKHGKRISESALKFYFDTQTYEGYKYETWINSRIDRLDELYYGYLFRQTLRLYQQPFFFEFEDILKEIEHNKGHRINHPSYKNLKSKFHKYWNYWRKRSHNYYGVSRTEIPLDSKKKSKTAKTIPETPQISNPSPERQKLIDEINDLVRKAKLEKDGKINKDTIHVQKSKKLNNWLKPKIDRLIELYEIHLYQSRLKDLGVWYFVEFEEILKEIDAKFDYSLNYNEDYKWEFHKYWNYALRRRENFVPARAKQSTPNIVTPREAKSSDSEPRTRNKSDKSPVVSSEDFFDKLIGSKDRIVVDNSKIKNEIGLAGELFYLNILEEDLKDQGVEGFPIHVSVEKGDRHGFDIASVNSVGDRIMIEVKTTTQGKRTPFYLTRNEYKVLKNYPMNYQIVRIYDFDLDQKSGRYFVIHGLSEFEQMCELEEDTFELVEDTQIYLFD